MSRSAYERMRISHLGAVQAALGDHVARLDWSRGRSSATAISAYGRFSHYARERSPFHARRLRGLDPSTRLGRRPGVAADDDRSRKRRTSGTPS